MFFGAQRGLVKLALQRHFVIRVIFNGVKRKAKDMPDVVHSVWLFVALFEQHDVAVAYGIVPRS